MIDFHLGLPMMMFGGFLLFLFVLFLLNVVTSIWAYRDALKQGNSKEFALIVLVGTLVFPVMGLIVYLIIRKEWRA